MALVRRTVALGRAHVPQAGVIPAQAVIPSSAPGFPPAPVFSPAPGFPPAAGPSPGAGLPPGAMSPHAPAGSPSGPAGGAPQGTVPPPPGYELAAAVQSMPAKGWASITGIGLAVLGAVGAFNIDAFAGHTPFPIGDTTSTFGALFVVSAAVERVLEPFSRFMPGRKEQAMYERAVADMDNGIAGATHAVAHYKAAVESARSSRGILMWGLATCAATLLSASSGFCLLRLLSSDPNWNGVSYWADALITGLIVGSGTKPLHDLLNKVQKQSNTTQTPI